MGKHSHIYSLCQVDLDNYFLTWIEPFSQFLIPDIKLKKQLKE